MRYLSCLGRICVLSVVLSLTACTTWKSVPVSHAPEKLHRGDKVMLKMVDGPNKKVKIQQVTDEAVVDTKGRYYDYRDMRGISRKKVSAVKTGTTVVGTTASVSAMAATTTVGFLLPVLGLGLSLGLILLV